MPGLSPKRAEFVRQYLIDRNGTQAAIRAGYRAPNAHVTASRLLDDEEVRRAIDEKTEKLAAKLELSAEKVLADIERIANDAHNAADFSAALKGKELLGKHLKLFIERHQHEGPDGKPLTFNINMGGK
jgi:phage terminase small subunit